MIYFDNAATSFPKPHSVMRSTLRHLKTPYGNPGRSSHALALSAAEAIYEVREAVASFLDLPYPDRVVFTSGATQSLNVAIKGSIPPNTHVLISDLEHNSVIRPLEALVRERGVRYDVFSTKGDIEANIKKRLIPTTRFIVSTLASNVTGQIVPLEILSRLRKTCGVRIIADASQLIGHQKISLQKTPIDILCAPGHKGLFGMMGAGILVIASDLIPEPLLEGGSGSHSKLLTMPRELPDRLEAGTLPLCPILSIKSGVDYLSKLGWDEIHARLQKLNAELNDRLQNIESVKPIAQCSLGICSVTHGRFSTEQLAQYLANAGICVRSGLHCAPLAHKAYGTQDSGTVRISLSLLNRVTQLDRLYRVLKVI